MHLIRKNKNADHNYSPKSSLVNQDLFVELTLSLEFKPENMDVCLKRYIFSLDISKCQQLNKKN